MSVDAEIKRVQENVRAGIALGQEEALRDGHLHDWTGAEYSEDTCGEGCGMAWGTYLREVRAALSRIMTEAGAATEEVEEIEDEEEELEEHDWVLTERHYVRTWSTEITLDDDGVETVTVADDGTFSDDGDGQMVLVCSDCDEERDAPDDVRWI